jgi:hypothetical protein
VGRPFPEALYKNDRSAILERGFLEMGCGEWNDEDWDTLIDSIQTGKCILMLGPGAAGEEIRGRFMPLTEILANKLAETSQIKEVIESFMVSN